jgi:4-carboxymuconolactone decarboxylase
MTWNRMLAVGFVAALVVSASAQERMPKLTDDKMTPEQKKAAAGIVAGPRGAVTGPFIPLLRSPDFADRVQRVGEYVRFKNSLSPKLNEMTAIMSAREWTNQFEFHAHYNAAVKAGLKQSIADAIATGKHPEGMAEDEEILYDFLHELFTTQGVSDKNYDRFVKKFGELTMIDTVGEAGYYTLLAMIMNVNRTAAPANEPPPPLKPLKR